MDLKYLNLKLIYTKSNLPLQITIRNRFIASIRYDMSLLGVSYPIIKFKKVPDDC